MLRTILCFAVVVIGCSAGGGATGQPGSGGNEDVAGNAGTGSAGMNSTGGSATGGSWTMGSGGAPITSATGGVPALPTGGTSTGGYPTGGTTGGSVASGGEPSGTGGSTLQSGGRSTGGATGGAGQAGNGGSAGSASSTGGSAAVRQCSYRPTPTSTVRLDCASTPARYCDAFLNCLLCDPEGERRHLNCDGDGSNGCEADVADPKHCGSCDRACAPGQQCKYGVNGDNAWLCY